MTDAPAQKNIDPQAMLGLAQNVGLLKRTVRTGWVRRGVDRPESVAEHSYRMGMLAMLYAPLVEEPKLDVSKCIKIGLVHDLAEGLVGDIVVEGSADCRDKISPEDKAAKEAKAMEEMFAELRPDLVDTWREYEDQTSAEARFMKDLDKLEMLIQADEYEEEQPTKDLSDFYKSTDGKIKSHVAKCVDALLRERKRSRDCKRKREN